MWQLQRIQGKTITSFGKYRNPYKDLKMAGHSHSSNIAVRKNAQDKKRAGAFTKVAREITTATRLSGPDPDMNPRLRLAVLKARAVDMPNDRIKRAIEVGTPGQDDGKIYEEVRYEGYGPNGVAVIIETLTENRTRTVGDLRVIFTKQGGTLGDNGAVSFMFDRVGEIVVAKEKGSADAMFEAAVEAGAQNVESDDTGHYVYTEIGDFGTVREALVKKFGEPMKSGLVWKGNVKTPLTTMDQAQSVLKLIDALEDNDDVQTAFTNMDLSADIAAKLAEDD